MKRIMVITVILLMVPLLNSFRPGEKSKPSTDEYLVIAWNDLGMHCANQDFSNMCILPPYNNQYAHVIKKGSQFNLPEVMPHSSGIYVSYEIPGNTWSVGKTNFWTYVQQLFGTNPGNNIGLTGNGLSGTMANADSINYHYATGIPVTAFPDATPSTPVPYQLTLIKAYLPGGTQIASTQSVIPVSHEINCVSSGCHSSENGILNAHENVPGYNPNNKPVFCATCHSDNALGMGGTPGVPPFSQVIHQKHGEFINTGSINDCYKCHPGPNTQCLRDTMHTLKLQGGSVGICQDCHGSVLNVGNTVENGREPWLQEPSCGATGCHGSVYAEEPGKLFKQSQGHGGLFCSTCHGSPHAIYTSSQPNDNVQNITLQGSAGILKECSVCHGYTPAAPGPHGYNPLGIKPISGNQPSDEGLRAVYPNPGSFMINIPFNIRTAGHVTLDVLDMTGKVVASLMDNHLSAGEYKAELYVSKLSPGTYICRLSTKSGSDAAKILVLK
ncbi:MAG: T9SS type A sorting domain-containing protein [Syntrophothermus sp.]